MVKHVSGREASEWVLGAANAAGEEAKVLSIEARLAAYDLTHKSFHDLASSMGGFVEEVGHQVISATSGGVGGNSVNVMMMNDVIVSGSQVIIVP